MTNDYLRELRLKFDQKIEKEKMSCATAKRYRDWARRYLNYCKALRLALAKDSCVAFLQTYQRLTTRRQAFFALKFLFLQVMEFNDFPETYIFLVTSSKRYRWRFWKREL